MDKTLTIKGNAKEVMIILQSLIRQFGKNTTLQEINEKFQREHLTFL